ncbi:hypothetical protein [Aurantiacibacter odishensis]|uniref:hypothetical protein n=1 Tax=Aurantiacibacter odishensis TaxID=1155476 RepID=UPI000E772D2F|nr:hypothetical protein [Aurantiacibacter odishensis]
MIDQLEIWKAQEQAELPGKPYDKWITPAGEVAAEFHREPEGYRIRFPGDADFRIDGESLAVRCQPVPGAERDVIETLFVNSVLPVIGNHSGQLNLHGSACALPGGAAAFIGQSRRGKTTLAGACARAGYPFLTEDVIRLGPNALAYDVVPVRPCLRLFGDSAAYLRNESVEPGAETIKTSLAASEHLPFADTVSPLRVIYVLGPGNAPAPSFVPIDPQHALPEVMQHAFVLDVEDKPRLQAHFERLSDLALNIPFVMLDYPRLFSELSGVVQAIVDDVAERGNRTNGSK